MPRIVIIGGGISGLATAYYLSRETPEVDLLLVDGESHLGGTLGSETIDGFIFERGANGYLDNVPHTQELVEDLGLGERVRAAAPEAAARFIYKGGRLLPVPTTPFAFLRSPLLSIRGRLRVLLERFQPRAPEGAEDSVASFGRRRLGEEAVRTFLDPLVSGIHAGDVERLSLASAFPRIAEMEAEHGSLMRAMAALRRERRARAKAARPAPASGAAGGEAGGAPDSTSGPAAAAPARPAGGPAGPGGRLCSFPGGTEELVEALQARIEKRCRLGWKATAIRREGQRFAIQGPEHQRETADGVVLAAPSYRAASLLVNSFPEVALALDAIPYAPIAVACFGFPRDAVRHPLAGFGFLVPRDQGLRVLGVIWVSSIYPDHAPAGAVSLRCFIGGARDPDALNHSDEHLQEMVLNEIRPLLGIDGRPSPARVYRYGRGIPQYNVGHRARIDRIERELWNLPGLFITGNAYYGISLNDCVREGKRKARAVREYFRI